MKMAGGGREDRSYPVYTWLWIDEDLDGIAERYYFGEDGYLRTDMDAPDGKSWPQITIDETLYRAANTRNGLDLLPERTQTEPVYPRQDMFGPVYSMQYKGKTITFSTDVESNCVSDYFGPVSVFFNNFPEQGMEQRAFYDNTGYESPASGRHVVASSGMLDSVFRLPMASYRVGDGYLSNERFPDGDWLSSGEWFSILLAPGDYQTWDINED